MADIQYRCPECAEKLCVHEMTAGQEILCPNCRNTGTVPHPGPSGLLLSVDMRFRCPTCEKKLSVDVRHAGEVTVCPACDQPFMIPVLPDQSDATSQTPASLLSQDEVKFLMAQ